MTLYFFLLFLLLFFNPKGMWTLKNGNLVNELSCIFFFNHVEPDKWVLISHFIYPIRMWTVKNGNLVDKLSLHFLLSIMWCIYIALPWLASFRYWYGQYSNFPLLSPGVSIITWQWSRLLNITLMNHGVGTRLHQNYEGFYRYKVGKINNLVGCRKIWWERSVPK